MTMRILPAPQFLSMNSCGLDISGRAIRFIELEENGNKLTPKRYGFEPVAEGVLVGGEIVKKDELVGAFKNLRQKYNLDFVKVSLPEEKAYLFKTTVPISEDEGNLGDSIAFNLEENVPIAGSEALYEWNIIDRAQHETTVSVSVFPQSFVQSYLDALTEAGLSVVSFDPEARSIARAIVPKGDQDTYLIVNIGETKTVFSIVSKGVVQFTSTVFAGGGMLTAVVQKYLNLKTKEEARTKKHQTNFIQNAAEKDIQQEFITTIGHITQEAKKLYAYWYMRKDNDESTKKIKKVILFGEDVTVPGLRDYITTHSDIPVEVANVWQNCFSLDEYVPEMSFDESMKYGAAVGLSLLK